jgi:hypothetical protein
VTDTSPPPDELPPLATVVCPYCGVVVPDASYCGACGAHLVHTGLRASQRMHTFAASPEEPVLRLSIVTSLFPHLSPRAKAPFRLAFAVVLVLLLVLALAGTDAPLIAVSALSVPLLFLLYIWEVDPYESSFLPPTLLCATLGAGLGFGWAAVGGSYVNAALVPSLTSSLTGHDALVAAVAVPVVGQLLMCLPMIIVRWTQPGPVESLDGFVAGATGALGFTLAATIDLMSPWLSTGQLTHQSFLANITQVLLRGVTLPLVSALATGFIGMAVWTTSGTGATSARARWVTSPVLALTVAFVVQIGLGFTDIAALSDAALIGIHLAALAVLILAMRVGVHYVLMHEALHVRIGGPRVCACCAHLIPTMAFCPECGVAERAVARPHRHGAAWPQVVGDEAPFDDRAEDPTDAGGDAPDAAWPTVPPGAPGLKIGFPGAQESASPSHRLRHRTKIFIMVGGLGVLTLAFVIAAFAATPGPPARCHLLTTCQGPPIGHPGLGQGDVGPPVVSGILYTNAQGFSVRYPPQASVQTTAQSIELTYDYVDGGASSLEIVGGTSAATPQSAVEHAVASAFPNTSPSYVLPDPLIGYQAGYGAAYQVQPASSDGSTKTDQVVVAAAAKNGFTIIVLEDGTLLPTVTSSSPFFNGHPSPAGVNMAYGVGDFIVNRIKFPQR